MFNYIDVNVFRENMTKYPNGLSIFEALSTVITSFNSYVAEINSKVAEGILETDAARTALSAELNDLFSVLREEYQGDFQGLQAEVDAAVDTINNKVSQEQLAVFSAQLGEIEKVFIPGVNLFNKNDIQAGHTLLDNGTAYPSANFTTSGYMTVKPSTGHIVKNARKVVFYNSSKVLISFVNPPSPYTNYAFTTPVNTAYIRVSWSTAEQAIATQQVNEGNALLPYQDYKEVVSKDYLEKTFELSDIADNSFPLKKTAFHRKSTNLFNKDAITLNAIVSSSNGSVITGVTGFIASDFMEVVASQKVYMLKDRQYAFYDVNKAFVSGGDNVNPFSNIVLTAPANAKYLRLSYHPVNETLPVEKMQVNIGAEMLPFEAYDALYIEQKYIDPKRPLLNLPPKIYAVVGKELNIYFDNIVTGKASEYQFDVTCTVGKQLTDKWTLTPASAGTYPLKIDVYSDYVNLVASITAELIVKSETAGTGEKKILVIGDSTTNAGTTTQKLLDLFTADVNMDIALYGSRGAAPNLHEGRGGWSAAVYRTNTVYESVVNPFYNGTDFDFGYYMTAQGYPVLDHVLINLGINDNFAQMSDAEMETNFIAVIAHYNHIINSIKAHDANIKVGVMVAIPPNASQDIFGEAYLTGQTQWRYKRNNAIWANKLIKYFKSVAGVYIVPTHLNIDTKNNINDGVHPKTDGYNQIGDSLYYYVKSFEA